MSPTQLHLGVFGRVGALSRHLNFLIRYERVQYAPGRPPC